MLRTRTSPSSITSAESPMGPSVGATSAWIVSVSGPGLERFEIDALDEPVEPQRPKRLLEIVQRVRGQKDRGVLVDMGAQVAWVEMVVVEVRDVQVRRVPDQFRIDGRRWPGRGTTSRRRRG